MSFIRQWLTLKRIRLYSLWMTTILPYDKIPAWLKDYRIKLLAKYLCARGGLARNYWLIQKIRDNKFY